MINGYDHCVEKIEQRLFSLSTYFLVLVFIFPVHLRVIPLNLDLKASLKNVSQLYVLLMLMF